MARRRWIADEVSGNHAVLKGVHARHLSRVLRAKVGQEFDVVAGGEVRCGRITEIGTDQVTFELGDAIPAATQAKITMALSIFKFDRMEWAIEKCTELGVVRIVPVIAHRTDSHLAASSGKRVERWRRIAAQAAEQSRRIAPPEIDAPIRLPEAINLPQQLRIVLSESEKDVMLADAFAPGAEEAVLGIGPEGGWTDEELHEFRAGGWISASLGGTILRAETAAIAGLAVGLSAISR